MRSFLSSSLPNPAVVPAASPESAVLSDVTGSKSELFIIGVTGGTASGKTSVCNEIKTRISSSSSSSTVEIVSQDCFYKPLTEEQIAMAHKSQFNFDHPSAFDTELIIKTLRSLREGKSVLIPSYSFTKHDREDISRSTRIPPTVKIIIFEGIMAFTDERIRSMFDLKIFVDTDSDTRLLRRIRRDIKERGRSVEGVLGQYERFVKPAFDDFIAPTKRYADIIIPRGVSNLPAIDLVSSQIRVLTAPISLEFSRRDPRNGNTKGNSKLTSSFSKALSVRPSNHIDQNEEM